MRWHLHDLLSDWLVLLSRPLLRNLFFSIEGKKPDPEKWLNRIKFKEIISGFFLPLSSFA